MKTIEDLKKLFPTLIELVANNNHEIGESYFEQDEDGWGRSNDYTDNFICYEEDGWCIEISYQCCGEWDSDPGDYWNPPYCDLVRAWGEVTEITAYHYDDESGEESDFTEEDLKELWSQIDEVLKDVA